MTTLSNPESTVNDKHTQTADNNTDNLPELGPDSILWQRFGDWRSAFVALSAGLLQIAQRDVSRSLVQHSNVFDNEVARLVRSAFPIIRTIYEGPEVGVMIRDFHKDIKGTHPDGSRYHPLNPDVYYWAHATFVYRVIYAQELFGTPFTKEERDQIVREGVTWWDKYGMSERPVIDNYDDLVAYMDDMVENVLERNETVDFALRTARVEPVKAPDGVPPRLWKIIWKPIMRSTIWLTIGTLPEKYRRILDLEWTSRDQKRFDRIAKAIRKVFTLLPEDKRFMEPGRSLMIKNGMIEGKYKEPKTIQAYQPKNEAAEASDTAKPNAEGDSNDAVAARRAAGCPF